MLGSSDPDAASVADPALPGCQGRSSSSAARSRYVTWRELSRNMQGRHQFTSEKRESNEFEEVKISEVEKNVEKICWEVFLLC